MRSNASSAARFAPSPIAWAATGTPSAAASRTPSASSSEDSSRSPEPSSIHAVREPSVPSMNALHGPTASIRDPKPARSSRSRAAGSMSSGNDMTTRSRRRRSASSRCHTSRPPLRWKSCTQTTPRALAAAMPSTTARLRSAAVGSGSGNRQESHSANTPSSLRTPVARIAALFTHSVWWSCAHSAAGRSPVTSSSAAAVGSPSGHFADSQPWPSSQPSPGSAAPIAASASARLAQCVSSSRPRSSAHSRKWRVAVGEPGQHAAPVEVEPLVSDGVDLALADVHAPGDQVVRHRQRGHLWQARIHRVDRAVVQDHGRLR